MIPILIRSGFKPAIAAAAVVCSTTPALLNPGVAHNVFVSKIANMEVMEFIGRVTSPILLFSLAIIVGLTIVCFIYRDYKNLSTKLAKATGFADNLPKKINPLYALAPLVPVVILLYVSLYTTMKMSVATAMLIGTFYALCVTRSNRLKLLKNSLTAWAKVMAISLASSLRPACSLQVSKAAGVIDLLVQTLTNANHLARIGGAFGPYLMGVLTGSGDAAAFAFNEAVTPNAPSFGLKLPI